MRFAVEDEAALNRACKRIVSDWRRPPSSNDRLPLLKQQAYELISHLKDTDNLELWQSRLERLSRKGRPSRQNEFSVGLRVIFLGVSDGPSPATRESVSLELEYAYRHFVYPVFLKGFLATIPKRPCPQAVEAGYEDWIAFNLRCRNDDGEDRGGYSKEILQRQREIRARNIPMLANLLMGMSEQVHNPFSLFDEDMDPMNEWIERNS